jgi:hypothetical protein
MSSSREFIRALALVALAALLATASAGCGRKGCGTGTSYSGDMVTTGTVSYGQPTVSRTLTFSNVDSAALACMQAPASCPKLALGVDADALGNPLSLQVTVVAVQSAQTLILPSPDVMVVASFDDRTAGIASDPGGAADGGPLGEPLTLTGGTLSIALTPDNLDARFDMTFVRASGDLVTLRSGRIACINGKAYTYQICTD